VPELLTLEEIGAELILELFDCPGQRRLRDVTFLSGLGEIELADRRKKII
jgi:hypothetical protein